MRTNKSRLELGMRSEDESERLLPRHRRPRSGRPVLMEPLLPAANGGSTNGGSTNGGSASGGSMEAALLKLHSAADLRQLWSALEKMLQRVVPSKAYSAFLNILEMRPQAILSTDNFIQRMSPGMFRELMENPFMPEFLRNNPGAPLVQLCDFFDIPHAEIRRMPFFKKFFSDFGFEHQVSILIWQGNELLATVSCLRTAEQGELSPRERERAEEVYPHIQTAITRLIRTQRERAFHGCLASLFREMLLPGVLLGWDLKVLFQNRAAEELCALWTHGVKEARALGRSANFGLPGEIQQGLEQLREEAQQALRHYAFKPPRFQREISHPQRPGLKAHVRMMVSGRHRMPLFFVQLSKTDGASVAGDGWDAAVARLSPAEREIVQLLREGLSNQEIAGRLHKSRETVKRQLSTIFRKLGVNSRSKLLAMLR